MPFTLFFYKKMTWIFKPFLNYLGNFEQIISSILDGKLSISSLVNEEVSIGAWIVSSTFAGLIQGPLPCYMIL